MAMYLRPRRGKKVTAENQNIILKRGEVFFELPATGIGTAPGKIKVGDGLKTYSQLPYFLEQTDVNNSAISFATDSETNNGKLLNKITSGAKLNTILGATRKILSNLDTSVDNLNKHIHSYQNDTLAIALKKLISSFGDVEGTYSGRFNCLEGCYTFHLFYDKDEEYNSGYCANITGADSYTFSVKAGADAVLKKLGENGELEEEIEKINQQHQQEIDNINHQYQQQIENINAEHQEEIRSIISALAAKGVSVSSTNASGIVAAINGITIGKDIKYNVVAEIKSTPDSSGNGRWHTLTLKKNGTVVSSNSNIYVADNPGYVCNGSVSATI